MLGQWQLIAQYAMFGQDEDLTNDPGATDAQGFTLAAKYFLSKRTGVYASFNEIKNKRTSFYDISNGGSARHGRAHCRSTSAGAIRASLPSA